MIKKLTGGVLAMALLLAAQATAKAEEIVLQSAQSGLYVTTLGGTLAASTRDRNRAIRLDTVRLEGNRIAFRDMRSGRYLRAGVGPDTLLATASPHIRSWETFEVRQVGGGKIALRSVQNGKFVRAGGGRNSRLSATSPRASAWESFRLIEVAGNAAGNGNAAPRDGLGVEDLKGNYWITHLAAANGYLVRLGNQFEGLARLGLDESGTAFTTVGCNNLRARLSIENGRIRPAGPVIGTKMLCQGDGVMAAEQALGMALEKSRSVSRRGNVITFKDARGAELMKLTRR